MEFPDLYEFPADHPPSPYNKPLPGIGLGSAVLPSGLMLRAIGWLERPGFRTGKVPGDCIERLIAALGDRIFSDGHRGVHSCTLCSHTRPEVTWQGQRINVRGHGHYLLQRDRIVYIAPEFLLHYILGHNYRPPDEFLDAITNGRLLTPWDLHPAPRSD